MTHWRFILVLLAALSATVVGVVVGTQHFSATASNTVDPQFWQTQLPNTRDQIKPLETFRGQLLVLNFWASWCPPCVEETPDLIELHQEFSKKNVQFLGIALDSAIDVEQFLKKHSIPYPNLIAASQPQLARYLTSSDSVIGLPVTAIISAEGEVIFYKKGRFDKNQLRESLLKALLNNSIK